MPTPLPGELRRALEQLRADVGANADGVRRLGHTQRWHGERLDRLEQEGARTVTASVTTATVEQQPYRSPVGYGEDTQTIMLNAARKALAEHRATEALETVKSIKGFGGDLAKTLVKAAVLAIAAVLATVLVMQAARTMGAAHHESESTDAH